MSTALSREHRAFALCLHLHLCSGVSGKDFSPQMFSISSLPADQMLIDLFLGKNELLDLLPLAVLLWGDH